MQRSDILIEPIQRKGVCQFTWKDGKVNEAKKYTHWDQELIRFHLKAMNLENEFRATPPNMRGWLSKGIDLERMKKVKVDFESRVLPKDRYSHRYHPAWPRIRKFSLPSARGKVK